MPYTKISPSWLLQTVLISYFLLPRSFITSISPTTSQSNCRSLWKLTVWLMQMLSGKLLPMILEKRQLTNSLFTAFEPNFLLFSCSPCYRCKMRLNCLHASSEYFTLQACFLPTCQQTILLASASIPINQIQNCVIFLQLKPMDEGDKEFISEEVMKIMDDAVNNLFGIREEHADKDIKAIYNKQKSNANVNNLIDFVIRGLCKLNKPFKYCVTGLIMQNNGSGLNTCALAYNDPNNDGAVTLQREVGDNIVVLTIFAMQI